MKTVVVGAGAWGTAFARLLHEHGHEVTLACRDAEQARVIAETGRNPKYLSDIALDGVAAAHIEKAPLEGAELVVVAVPSRSFAEEIGSGLPAAAVIASEDDELAERLQQEINSLIFRVYLNQDVVGVELCAAAKNVIALAAGGVDGLELGDNAKTAIITRGLAEMARLGEACGARAETFAGLAGMGDLIVTCWSRHGRNRRAGELIARGASPEAAADEIGTVEGLTTAPVLRELAGRLGIELPITNAVCEILDGRSLDELIAGLMGRRPRAE